MKKKLMAIFTALVMMLTMLPFGVESAFAVVDGDAVDFLDLQSELADPDTTTITITQGITLTENLTIPAGKTVTTGSLGSLSTGEFTLTVEGTIDIVGSSLFCEANGNVNVNENGKITNSLPSGLINSGSITVDFGGLIENKSADPTPSITNAQTGEITVNSYGTITNNADFSNDGIIRNGGTINGSGSLTITSTARTYSDDEIKNIKTYDGTFLVCFNANRANFTSDGANHNLLYLLAQNQDETGSGGATLSVLPATPIDPSGLGYHFIGWSLFNSDLAIGITDKTVFTQDTEYYAAWNTTGAVTFHSIDVVVNGNGTVALSLDNEAIPHGAKVSSGNQIAVSASPNNHNEVLRSLTVKQGDNDVPLNNGVFTMPKGDVTLTATFEEIPPGFFRTWTEAANDAQSGSDYTQNGDILEIHSAKGLAYFAASVNGTLDDGNGGTLSANTYEGKTVVLTKDIDLKDGKVFDYDGTVNAMASTVTELNSWKSIGNLSNNIFNGTFDGKGFEISSLYIKGGGHGLFGVVGEKGTVKNLGVISSQISSTGDFVGGIASINDGKIINCYNTGSVSGTNDVGGIVGHNPGSVINCYNTGSVSGGGSDRGSVVGDNTGSVESCYYRKGSAEKGIGGTSNLTGSTVYTSTEMQTAAFADRLNDWVFKQYDEGNMEYKVWSPVENGYPTLGGGAILYVNGEFSHRVDIDFDKFKSITVDGVVLTVLFSTTDGVHYLTTGDNTEVGKLYPGSIIVNFNEAYMQTLPYGAIRVDIGLTDGTVETFYIYKKQPDGVSSPATSDSNNMLWLSMIAMLAVGGAVIFGKKATQR